MKISVSAITNNDTKDGFNKFAQYCNELGKNIAPQLSAILNQTATKVRTSTNQPLGLKQELQKMYASGFKARDINALLKQYKASKNHLQSVVHLKRKNRPSISLFKPSFTKAGVTYKMLRGEGRKTIPDGFDFKKQKKVARRAGKKRFPLVFPKGVSPAALFLGNNNNNLDTRTEKKMAYWLLDRTEERMKYLAFREAKNKGLTR